MTAPLTRTSGGVFITFEGVDGSGKTTQARLAHEALSRQFPDREVVLTRNPGGTAIGAAIRQTLLHPPGEAPVNPVCELLLYLADRAQHIDELVRPALQRGAIVICDRFSDSTVAYQGAGRRLDPDTIATIDAIARQGIQPDLTLLYDADPAQLAQRLAWRATQAGEEPPNRLDAETLTFKNAVREGFLGLAKAQPQRVVVVNALASLEAVHAETMTVLQARLTLV